MRQVTCVCVHLRPINGTVESAHFMQLSYLIKSLRIISPKNPLEIEKNYLSPSKSQTFSQLPRLIFFARTLGELTESALPPLNLLDVLTVNNVYRLHILKFTHLWHKGLLPVLFQNYFQYARYASKPQNLYKPKERTNTGKQTVTFSASVLWDDSPVDLKNLNAFKFSKN